MRNFLSFAKTGLLFLLLAACSPLSPGPIAPSVQISGFATTAQKPQLPAEARLQPDPQMPEAWNRHLRESATQPLQTACQPFHLPARGSRQGAILLFHGYSACPQQYWELAPRLAARGFDVYVPLLPGHGRAPRPEGNLWQDRSDDLPTEQDWTRYQRQARELAEVMPTQGQRVVAGLSLGGAVAASALIQAPQHFDRGLIMTALLDVHSPQNKILPLLNAVTGARKTDWGAGCERERAGGRGGYCQFRMQHLRALQIFGQKTLAEIHKIQVPLQISGVEKDPVIDNGALFQAARKVKQSQLCLMEAGVNHSMLSPYDTPDQPKFWLPTLFRQLDRFLITGQFFTTRGVGEGNQPRCGF